MASLVPTAGAKTFVSTPPDEFFAERMQADQLTDQEDVPSDHEDESEYAERSGFQANRVCRHDAPRSIHLARSYTNPVSAEAAPMGWDSRKQPFGHISIATAQSRLHLPHNG